MQHRRLLLDILPYLNLLYHQSIGHDQTSNYLTRYSKVKRAQDRLQQHAPSDLAASLYVMEKTYKAIPPAYPFPQPSKNHTTLTQSEQSPTHLSSVANPGASPHSARSVTKVPRGPGKAPRFIVLVLCCLHADVRAVRWLSGEFMSGGKASCVRLACTVTPRISQH